MVVASRQAHRMVEVFAEHRISAGVANRLDDPPPAGGVVAVPQALTSGFSLDDLVVVSDAEILGWRRRRQHVRWLSASKARTVSMSSPAHSILTG